MENSDSLRHQLIANLIAQHTENDSAAAILLWEQMAAHIISIVGEGGFNALFARSVFLTQTAFPWIAACALSPQTDHRFAQLKTCLEGQAPTQASAANSLLLIVGSCLRRLCRTHFPLARAGVPFALMRGILAQADRIFTQTRGIFSCSG